MSVTERLIENVKLHTILYDMSHPDYKNSREKFKVWEDMGQLLDRDGEDLKKKWKNLRDCYAKHLRAEITHIGPKAKAINRYKTWPWAQQMSEFKPYLQVSHTYANFNIKDESPQEANDNQGSEEKQPPSTEVTATGSHSSQRKPRKINLSQNHKPADDHYDDVDLLCLGYAKSIKKLSQRRQTLTKYHFAKIIMEAELEEQSENCGMHGNAENHSSPSSNVSYASRTTSPTYLLQHLETIIDS